MEQSLLTSIDAVVGDGRATISADDSVIVDIVKETIRSGRTASFYLPQHQAEAVKAWYWTSERIKSSNIRVVLEEEKARIRSELGVEVNSFRCSRIECECGQVYGGFEFLQQGVREHGVDAVKAVFEMKNTMLFRANPAFRAICPNCREMLGDLEYDCDQYGGCCIAPA
ncbi:hypothetical protein [Streptomyces tubercidicus]